MRRWARFILAAFVVLLLMGTRLARSHINARWRTVGLAAAGIHIPAAPRPDPACVPEFVNDHFAPPIGTISCQLWTGHDSHGRAESVGAFNCFESVNYLLTGDPNQCIYRAWPHADMPDPQSAAAWTAFDRSLRPGDVVEFIAKIRNSAGTLTTNPFHAQLCVAAGGTMYGANNTPAFTLADGVPTLVRHWDACRPQDYYAALRAMDPAWAACGFLQTYRVVVYRHP